MAKRGETELPALNIRRKAAVLQALRSGALTLEQARERYALSVEEIRAWERDLEKHGLYGLLSNQAATRRAQYRNVRQLNEHRAFSTRQAPDFDFYRGRPGGYPPSPETDRFAGFSGPSCHPLFVLITARATEFGSNFGSNRSLPVPACGVQA